MINPDPERKPKSSGDQLFLVLFSLLLFGLFAGSLVQHFEPAKLTAVFFFLAWPALTALHEGAHALVARAWGWRVMEVVIGSGPLWRTLHLSGIRVELRYIPLSGYVLPVPGESPHNRLASSTIYLAGPLAELAVVGLCALVVGGFSELLLPIEAPLDAVVRGVAAAAMVGALTNLVPIRFASGQASDGLGAIVSLFQSDADIEDRKALQFSLRGRELLEAGQPGSALDVFDEGLERFPDSVALHIGAAEALLALGERAEALTGLQAEAMREGRSAAFKRRAQAALDDLRAR